MFVHCNGIRRWRWSLFQNKWT